MQLCRFEKILFSFLMISGVSSGALAIESNSKKCSYSLPWETVDTQSSSVDLAGRAVVSSQTAVFVGGGALNQNMDINPWIIRRSLDQGATWETVDYNASRAAVSGLAIDPSKGWIYAVSDTWLVRKSSDNGGTWQTVDTLKPSEGLFAAATSVAVDKRGVVYVAGVIEFPTTQRWIVRRSENGGQTWDTVDIFNGPQGAAATTIQAPRTGVFVGGYYVDSNGKHRWAVRYSRTGLGDWSTVNTFTLGNESVAMGSAVSSNGKEIVMVGSGQNSMGQAVWVVRKALCLSPYLWKTVETYDPSTPMVPQSAEAIAAAFTREGKLFVTGRQGLGTHVYVTRQGSLVPGSFFMSDLFSSGKEPWGRGAGSTAEGDVYTTGVAYQGADRIMITRRLQCAPR